MNMHDRAEAAVATPKTTGIVKSVQTCNFRLAGRLSNENARSLMALHDSFARQLGNALDVYLSKAVEFKLLNIDQVTLKEHLEHTSSFVVPFSLGTLPGHPLLELDDKLTLTIIEILMGGSGQISQDKCELSEIDREILNEVTELVAIEAERAWHIPGVSVVANESIRPEAIQRFCIPDEKLTVFHFGVRISDTSGFADLLLPANFVMEILRQIKFDQPQKRNVWQFPKVPLRERLLDCDIHVSAELSGLKVAVRDLIELQPGSVLKLRAPIQTPGMLTAGGRSIFEAFPVRNGSQRAAQLVKRISQFEAQRGREL